MISTEAPSCVREIAVFTAVVVLPSPAWPLVINIVLGGLPAVDSSIEVLTARYASAAVERLSNTIASTRVACLADFRPLPASSRLRFLAGTSRPEPLADIAG